MWVQVYKRKWNAWMHKNCPSCHEDYWWSLRLGGTDDSRETRKCTSTWDSLTEERERYEYLDGKATTNKRMGGKRCFY